MESAEGKDIRQSLSLPSIFYRNESARRHDLCQLVHSMRLQKAEAYLKEIKRRLFCWDQQLTIDEANFYISHIDSVTRDPSIF